MNEEKKVIKTSSEGSDSVYTQQQLSDNRRSRDFCVTIYDTAQPRLLDKMRYLQGESETCPTTGRSHWQCHFILATSVSFKACLRYLRDSGYEKFHLSFRNGSFDENVAYCSKVRELPGTVWFEFGERPSPGKRSDLEYACAQALACGLSSVPPSTFVKYSRGLEKLIQLHRHPVSLVKVVKWYWGPSGCGKSHLAWSEFPNAFDLSSDNGWWDGYDTQTAVIIDDYDSHILTIREFLRITDKYPYRVKVKGSMVPFCATDIRITSHFSPQHYFPSERWSEISRRITEIKKISKVAD